STYAICRRGFAASGLSLAELWQINLNGLRYGLAETGLRRRLMASPKPRAGRRGYDSVFGGARHGLLQSSRPDAPSRPAEPGPGRRRGGRGGPPLSGGPEERRRRGVPGGPHRGALPLARGPQRPGDETLGRRPERGDLRLPLEAAAAVGDPQPADRAAGRPP